MNKGKALIKFVDATVKESYLKHAKRVLPWNLSLLVYPPLTPQVYPSSFIAIHGSHKSKVLGAIQGKYVCDPPVSSGSTRLASLSFADATGIDRSHMSARYEAFSHRGKLEMELANLTLNYIRGSNNYNQLNAPDPDWVNYLLAVFDLQPLADRWVGALSNGQMRRARLARALVHQPHLLVLDDPFLGLDTMAREWVVESLGRVAQGSAGRRGTSVILGLGPSDPVPGWIDKCYRADENGFKEAPTSIVQDLLVLRLEPYVPKHSTSPPHIEIRNGNIAYGNVAIFKNLNWTVNQGEKWRITGGNGTGKTTLLLMVAAEHPQLWRGFMYIDGKKRLVGLGASFFALNNEIGVLLPELHSLVPQSDMTMMEIIRNGLARDVGSCNFAYAGLPQRAEFPQRARDALKPFQAEIREYGNCLFSDLDVTMQKLCLFLRAIVKAPRILVLDEAFSGMEDERLIRKCHEYVEALDETTVLAIGHVDTQVPRCQYMLQLTGVADIPARMFRYLRETSSSSSSSSSVK